MIGIIIGILSIVSLISLGEGLRIAVVNQFGIFALDMITISTGSLNGPPGTGGAEPFPKSYINKIKSLKEIKEATGRNFVFTKLIYDNTLAITSISSLPYGKERDLIYYGINLKPWKGRLLKDTDSGKIIIGPRLANSEDFSKPIAVGSNIFISNKKFKVVGIFKKSGNFMLDNAAFINEKDFIDLFPEKKNKYSFIVARYNTIYTISQITESLENLLIKLRHVKKSNEDFEIKTPQSILNNLNSTLFAVQLFVYIIAAISILVGGIGIMSTMYTTVLERTREIGIMKSIGATRLTIFTIFFIESGFIGLVGGIIGTIIGSLISIFLSSIGRTLLGSNLIQSHISFSLIFLSLLFSFLLGTLFGTLPAIKASNMNPVEALSYSK